jgi:deazaflavin-dependent oxidoreductase (nitroreductase family)
MPDYYRAPGWFTLHVFNQLVAFLTRHGISVLGSRVLAVKGRTTGQWRTTPVNLLTHEGRRYLVAPRGETQWVRNLRAAGTGELRVGGRAESFRGRELESDSGQMTVQAGQGVQARAGEWVRYSTPGSDGAEYVSVCVPAFTPGVVHRDG